MFFLFSHQQKTNKQTKKVRTYHWTKEEGRRERSPEWNRQEYKRNERETRHVAVARTVGCLSALFSFFLPREKKKVAQPRTSKLLLSWPRKGVSVAGASFRNGISAMRKVSCPTITGAIPFHSSRQGCWPVQRHARHRNYCLHGGKLANFAISFFLLLFFFLLPRREFSSPKLQCSLSFKYIYTWPSEINNIFITSTVISVLEKKATNYFTRFGHSLWSANQLPAQGVNRLIRVSFSCLSFGKNFNFSLENTRHVEILFSKVAIFS